MAARFQVGGRIVVLACLISAPAGGAEKILVDDFHETVEGRWQAISGAWVVEDGVMTHRGKDAPDHDMAVADVPFVEGTIEVKATALSTNAHSFASVGIVIKYLDEKNNIWFRFGSYGQTNVDGYGPPGFDKMSLGKGKPELGRTYDLAVIIRGGRIALCIDDVMVGIIADPYPGQPGRPGLFSESGARFDDFRVAREDP